MIDFRRIINLPLFDNEVHQQALIEAILSAGDKLKGWLKKKQIEIHFASFQKIQTTISNYLSIPMPIVLAVLSIFVHG